MHSRATANCAVLRAAKVLTLGKSVARPRVGVSGSIPAQGAGANMACVCPDIEQRDGIRTMGFMTDVIGDALGFMQSVWDERDSFTRVELGWVPSWADYVGRDGQLWSDYKVRNEFERELTGAYGTVTVCGFEYEAGDALRTLDPVAFGCGVADWLDARERDGDLRRIEG